MKQPVVLRVYKGDKLETVRQFEGSQIVIGRNSDVQLELQDEGVALLHAMIEERGNDYYVSDLGSQSGTFKGGNRILEDRLSSGDEITLGPYRIQFFVGVPKPAAERDGALEVVVIVLEDCRDAKTVEVWDPVFTDDHRARGIDRQLALQLVQVMTPVEQGLH